MMDGQVLLAHQQNPTMQFLTSGFNGDHSADALVPVEKCRKQILLSVIPPISFPFASVFEN